MRNDEDFSQPVTAKSYFPDNGDSGRRDREEGTLIQLIACLFD